MSALCQIMAVTDEREFGQVLESVSDWLLDMGFNVRSMKYHQKTDVVSSILKNELLNKYAWSYF